MVVAVFGEVLVVPAVVGQGFFSSASPNSSFSWPLGGSVGAVGVIWAVSSVMG